MAWLSAIMDAGKVALFFIDRRCATRISPTASSSNC